MIKSKKELLEYIAQDSKNFKRQLARGGGKCMTNLRSNPISDQKYIWLYIKTLRYVEYYDFKKKSNKFYSFVFYYHLKKLRNLSYRTGFQIPPHTCGKGLTIWHWGPIIVNPAARLGENCTLYPGVLIGHKTFYDAPIIGDNVFIGAGTKIIGPVKIGDNVTIGQNCVIVNDVPTGSIIVSSPIRCINTRIE